MGRTKNLQKYLLKNFIKYLWKEPTPGSQKFELGDTKSYKG